jgi:diacylglycerol kinase (ATP)
LFEKMLGICPQSPYNKAVRISFPQPPYPIAMSERKNTSHLRKALGWSLSGLASAWRETAFRQEIYSLCVLAPLALWLGSSGLERAVLLASLLLVLIVELINTAVESTIDRIGPERHLLSGRAKDLASAAVFIALINAVLVWLLILLG